MRVLGSTFRNPLEFPLGKLFNVCSLRVLKRGGRGQSSLYLSRFFGLRFHLKSSSDKTY
jgi:hypothetical protein